ncbi:MAG: transglycosylase SLT domain-containing protein [Candidatus Thorarchaeota archaeon]
MIMLPLAIVSCEVDFSTTPLAEFGDLINHYARDNLLDPWMVAALVMVESAGDPEAYNENSMATGLGQVMPREAGEVFAHRPSSEELKDPETNIIWTCTILAARFHLLHDYEAAMYWYSGGTYWEDYDTYKQRYWSKIKERKEWLYEAGARNKPAHEHGNTDDSCTKTIILSKFGN